jgi:hypothetical protein
MLTFEVASFDIGYNCILGRSFLLKFIAVIHTTYATVKMPGPRGAITHVRRFGREETQKLAAKVARKRGAGTLAKAVTPGTSAGGRSKMSVAKQK